MKIFGLKNIVEGVLLGLAVVAVLPMSTMTAMAALPEAATCRTHPDCNHIYVESFKDSGLLFAGTMYWTNGATIDVSNGSTVEFDSEKIEAGIVGWYYANSTSIKLEPCNGHGSAEPEPTPSSDDKKDNDNHGSGSNDDDSRPAPPSPHQLAQTTIFSSLDAQLASSNTQATIDGKDLVNALPSATMQKISEYPNVTVFFTYNYNGAKYTTAIPAGAAIDSSLEWYGPIYMMTHYPTMWRQDDNTSVPVVAPVQ